MLLQQQRDGDIQRYSLDIDSPHDITMTALINSPPAEDYDELVPYKMTEQTKTKTQFIFYTVITHPGSHRETGNSRAIRGVVGIGEK